MLQPGGYINHCVVTVKNDFLLQIKQNPLDVQQVKG